MIETIKEIILDSQLLQFDIGLQRHLEIKPLKGKAATCIGVRRSGKSTYLYQIMDKLIASGISPRNILYINFFDDRLYNLQHESLSLILEAYFSIYPEKKSVEQIYCFFDEIQIIPEWESFIDRLMRTEKCMVYITGSSAQLLANEIATQMRGRALSWEIFPFSFKEFLDYKGVKYHSPYTSRQRLLIQKSYEEFWERGGFPEVAGVESAIRVKIHQEYLNTILFRDIIERHDISHPKALIDLAHKLINNIASLYSINSLTGYLKALGHKVPKSEVANYINWFEDAYFFFTVKIFDASIARSNTNPKKIYCIDSSMVTSVASGILVNSGHLLENLVFITLRRVIPKVYYYKTKKGREVDFIVQMSNHSRVLIQVCQSLQDHLTRKREVTALEEAMLELGLSNGLIVTNNEDEKIDVKPGKIIVLPAWRFLLNFVDNFDILNRF